MDHKKSKLEKEILRFLINKYKGTTLSKQLSNSIIKSREYTGVGFYINFIIASDLGKIKTNELESNPIIGPYIESSELKNGAGSQIFIKDGYITTLEIFSFSDNFPKKLEDFNLKT